MRPSVVLLARSAALKQKGRPVVTINWLAALSLSKSVLNQGGDPVAISREPFLLLMQHLDGAFHEFIDGPIGVRVPGHPGSWLPIRA
jgi:hypothetical protein